MFYTSVHSSMTEAAIQARIVQLLRNAHPPILFTSTGAGIESDVKHRTIMKRMGYTKGMPDLFIFEPSRGYHGLVVELKTVTGVLRPEQKQILSAFRDRGYCAVVARGYDEAVAEIESYLELKISHTEHAVLPSVSPAQPSTEKPH